MWAEAFLLGMAGFAITALGLSAILISIIAEQLYCSRALIALFHAQKTAVCDRAPYIVVRARKTADAS